MNTMITPELVQKEAKKREKENMRFRTYLKCHADEEKLDRDFLRLHKKYFKDYDCSQCRNCCKMYCAEIPREEVGRDAALLGLSEAAFIEKYLEPDQFGMKYQSKHVPCDFMMEDGNCMLGECKPEGCKLYPYTDQPERLHSLYSVLSAVEVCPVAFEIFEELKREYRFRGR